MVPSHQTAETVGDVGSPTLLGLAIVGALITVGAYWLLVG
ncbi:hypothetical protein MMMDOFMJ_1749 [Methylobacterium gnaphalii]|nr:hypothetical protein MMMDOFMJ_1749 [Methylobacterium gnaphalii]